MNQKDQSLINNMDKKTKRRLKFSKKIFEMKQAILHFDSVLFTLKTLYECRLLKNGAIILRDICEDLVKQQLLIKVDHGTGFSTKAVTIYIKVLPDQNSYHECQQFITALATLGNSHITMQSVLDSCRKIKYVSKNRPVDKIFEVLNRPQYKILNLDLTVLYCGKIYQNVPRMIVKS